MTEFPPGFFDRADETPDPVFYSFDRFVTHIDAGAIAAVTDLYRELELTGDVLDLCSSWVSHFGTPPRRLVSLGMNARELEANEMATDTIVHDLNVDPRLPFDDDLFDAVTCCVSIDYLVRPLEVFEDVARVLRPGGVFVITFSNRCFPSKAIHGWLAADDRRRCAIVAAYFDAVESFGPPISQHRNPMSPGDPLYAVWARTRSADIRIRPATTDDQAFISEMQFAALFVPPGGPPFDRDVLDADAIRPYHVDFGTRAGDVGRVAVDATGRPVGAAWVRRVRGFGFVDDDTPELGLAVVDARRGEGIGRALLDAVVEAVPRLSLSTDRRNPAVRLYRRVGFEVVREDGEHALVMLCDRTRP